MEPNKKTEQQQEQEQEPIVDSDLTALETESLVEGFEPDEGEGLE